MQEFIQKCNECGKEVKVFGIASKDCHFPQDAGKPEGEELCCGEWVLHECKNGEVV